MSKTFDDGIAALNRPESKSIEGLRELVNQVSAKVPDAAGAVTLVSDGMVNDVPASRVASAIAEASDGKVQTIADTPVHKFVSSVSFQDALRDVTGPVGFDASYNGVARADGTRTEGMFDIASRNFATAATGNVYTISPNAQPGSVFMATELPELLQNTNVKQINGIERAELNQLAADLCASGRSKGEADEIVCRAVNKASETLVASRVNELAVDGPRSQAVAGDASVAKVVGDGELVKQHALTQADLDAMKAAVNEGTRVVDTYRVNRDLSVMGDSARSIDNPLTHTFLARTDSDGQVVHTYSWGNDANLKGWNLDQPLDMRTAGEAIKTGLAEKVGDLKLDPFVDKEFEKLNRKENEHPNLILTANCKTEATKLIEGAKTEQSPPQDQAKQPMPNLSPSARPGRE